MCELIAVHHGDPRKREEITPRKNVFKQGLAKDLYSECSSVNSTSTLIDDMTNNFFTKGKNLCWKILNYLGDLKERGEEERVKEIVNLSCPLELAVLFNNQKIAIKLLELGANIGKQRLEMHNNVSFKSIARSLLAQSARSNSQDD